MKNSDIVMGRVFTDENGNQIVQVHDCYALDVGVRKSKTPKLRKANLYLGSSFRF